MKRFIESFLEIARSAPNAYKDPARYDFVVKTLYGRQKVADDITRLLLQEVPVLPKKAPVILEQACGSGILTLTLARQGYKVIASDLEVNALQALERKNPDRLAVSPIFSDMNSSFPIASESLDAAVVLSANRYIQDKTLFAREVYRTLKPNGVLIWPAGIFGLFLKNFGAKLEPFSSTKEIARVVQTAGFEVTNIDILLSLRRNLVRGVPPYSIPTYVIAKKPS